MLTCPALVRCKTMHSITGISVGMITWFCTKQEQWKVRWGAAWPAQSSRPDWWCSPAWESKTSRLRSFTCARFQLQTQWSQNNPIPVNSKSTFNFFFMLSFLCVVDSVGICRHRSVNSTNLCRAGFFIRCIHACQTRVCKAILQYKIWTTLAHNIRVFSIVQSPHRLAHQKLNIPQSHYTGLKKPGHQVIIWWLTFLKLRPSWAELSYDDKLQDVKEAMVTGSSLPCTERYVTAAEAINKTNHVLYTAYSKKASNVETAERRFFPHESRSTRLTLTGS